MTSLGPVAKRSGVHRTVTLKHLAANLSESHEISKRQTEAVLGDLVNLVTRHLKKGYRIRMGGGLGTLVARKPAALRGLSKPMTGELVRIKPKRAFADVGVIEAQVTPSVATEELLPESAYKPSARAIALLRGKEICERDLKASGGSFTLEEAAKLLGISRQAVAERVRDNALLAIPGPHARRLYPVVQFTNETEDGILPGLKEVLDSLPSANGWFRLNFLVTPDTQLGGRPPVELLKKGRIDPVVMAAKAVGVQGA
jgi:DNA-binding protein HU-beta